MEKPSGETIASRVRFGRRTAGKIALTGLAGAGLAIATVSKRTAFAQPGGQEGTPETPQEKERREFLERFEFNATPDQQRITLKLTEAGQKALSDPSLGFSPNNEQLANVTVWLLEEKQRAGQLDIPIDPAGVNPRTIADYLAQRYGPQPGQDPNRSFLVEVKQGEKSVYRFNPLSGMAWAQFDIPFSVLQPQQESAAAQPAEPESQPDPPVEPTLDPTEVAQWLEDIQRGNATATPNLSAGTPMPDQKTTALLPVGVSNSSLRRFIAYVCGIPVAAGAALVGGWALLRRMAGGKTETYTKGYDSDEEKGVEGKVETETNVTYGEPNPIVSAAATPRPLSKTPSSAPPKGGTDRQNPLPPDFGNPTRPREQLPQKRYSTSQLIRNAEKLHARHPDRLPRALAFWEKWIKNHPDQVTEDRPSSERVVDSNLST